MHSLKGKTALVTGASKNLGKAIALGFAEAGADVALTSHSAADDLEAVAAEARSFGVRAVAAIGDVSSPADVERLVGRFTREIDPIDILVSNASQRPRTSFLDISIEEWDSIIRTNLSASFYLTRRVIGGMSERGYGRIILIGGPDGQRPEPYKGAAHRVHCNTAKAGLIGMMKGIAVEFGAAGVTSNVVSPGIMDTTRDPVNYPHWPMSQEELDRRLSIPRLGKPSEISSICTYLCSDGAAYLTGQTIHVSGGYYMP